MVSHFDYSAHIPVAVVSLAGIPAMGLDRPGLSTRRQRLVARRALFSVASTLCPPPDRPECATCATADFCGYRFNRSTSPNAHAPCSLYVPRMQPKSEPELPGLDCDPRLPSAQEIDEYNG